MADGDRYHKALERCYQQLFKKVVQGQLTVEELAHQALKPHLRNLTNYGDGIVEMLNQIGQMIAHEIGTPMDKFLLDQDELKSKAEDIACHFLADHRGKNLALAACERYIEQINVSTDTKQVFANLLSDYIMNSYTSDFESLAKTDPRTQKLKVSLPQVKNKLAAMRPYFQQYVTKFVPQIARHLSLEGVRLPTAPRSSEIVAIDEMLN